MSLRVGGRCNQVKYLAIFLIVLLLPGFSLRREGFSNPAESEEQQVRVNTATGIYYYPGTGWYGNTNQGKFMSEKDAIAQGFRSARNGQ